MSRISRRESLAPLLRPSREVLPVLSAAQNPFLASRVARLDLQTGLPGSVFNKNFFWQAKLALDVEFRGVNILAEVLQKESFFLANLAIARSQLIRIKDNRLC